MGIRFACHACHKQLNIKDELAGKRGKCPRCGVRFRIPNEDREFSLRIEERKVDEDREGLGNPPGGDDGGEGESDSGSFAVEEAVESPASQTASPQTASPQTASPQTASPQTASPQPASPQPASPQPASPQPAQPPPLSAVEEPGFDPLADPLAQWYVRPASGGQYGPADGPTLRQWVSEQRLAANSLLWRDGWAEWRVASEVFPEIAVPDPQTAPREATVGKPASAGGGVVQAGGRAVGRSAARADAVFTAPQIESLTEPLRSEVSPPPSASARQGGSSNATLSSKSAAASRADAVPATPEKDLSPASTAETYLGARRRRKQRQRVALISLLVATSLLLIAALIAAIAWGP